MRPVDGRGGALAVGQGVVVRADGPDVLTWTLEGLQPLWTWRAEAQVADVALTAGWVWVLCADGSLWGLRTADGSVERRLEMPRPGRALAAAGGLVACLAVGGVAWAVDGQKLGEIRQAGLVDLAVDPQGEHLAVLTGVATLALVDPREATSPRQVALGLQGRAVHASPQGFWAVAGPREILPVSLGCDQVAPPLVEGLAESPSVALTLHGAAVARRTEARVVELVGLRDGADLGAVRLGRDVEVVAATQEQLVLGLPHGDVQVIDLVREQRQAARPHPGRATRPWAVDDQIDRSSARGALARLRIGAEAVAVHNVRTGAGPAWWTPLAWAGGVGATLLAVVLLVWWMGWV